jgi:ER lumen protein retaining receptor
MNFRFAIAPSLLLAVVWNESAGFSALLAHPGKWLFEVAWAFSIFLESVAILPQLIMITRHQKVENITALYMASLGAYRALYLANWVWRYWSEPHYWSPIAWVAGAVQTAIYSDFLWEFYKHKTDTTKSNAPYLQVLPK